MRSNLTCIHHSIMRQLLHLHQKDNRFMLIKSQ
nr:MAG TPA: hypothetical protein [Caudoviricetes sp.]